MTSLVRTTLLVALGAALSSLAAAQSGGIRVTPGVPVAPLILEGEVVLTQRPIPPLDPEQLEQLRVAQSQRSSGLLDKAHATVTALLATVPHHPLALNELSKIEVARQNWAEVERLGRTERAARRDSLLLGRDLVLALERMGREKDGAQVALECWIVRTTESEWAFSTIARLAVGEPKGVRDAMHRVAASYPDRVDLQRGAIRLDWKMGDDRGAMRALLATDRPGITPPLRWTFADELLRAQSSRDSSGAVESLLSMSGDTRYDPTYRLLAARRAWDIQRLTGASSKGAGALYDALKDIPRTRWNGDLLVEIARGLRESGRTADARALLETDGLQGAQQTQVTLERALADLRDGPPARALPALSRAADTSPEARFRWGEALFFCGLSDSALSVYKRASTEPNGPYTGAALERIYLIEDADPKSALPIYARMAYLHWRGDDKATLQLADSLYKNLPRGTLWAQVAVFLSQRLEEANRYEEAVAPLLALANDHPGDRLAPLARQRAGDLYFLRLKDETAAIAQYEECVTRYPRSWNAAEVRRKLELLRKRRS
jgi:tetratricopeptide (TPR) repeat protein